MYIDDFFQTPDEVSDLEAFIYISVNEYRRQTNIEFGKRETRKTYLTSTLKSERFHATPLRLFHELKFQKDNLVLFKALGCSSRQHQLPQSPNAQRALRWQKAYEE